MPSFCSAVRYASASITAIECRSAKVISVVLGGIGDCRSSATVRSPPQITRTLQISENASVIISTHLIYDVENVLDDAIFIRNGQIVLADSADNIRENSGKTVDMLFREVFRC